jgi:hypothetical protein
MDIFPPPQNSDDKGLIRYFEQFSAARDEYQRRQQDEYTTRCVARLPTPMSDDGHGDEEEQPVPAYFGLKDDDPKVEQVLGYRLHQPRSLLNLDFSPSRLTAAFPPMTSSPPSRVPPATIPVPHPVSTRSHPSLARDRPPSHPQPSAKPAHSKPYRVSRRHCPSTKTKATVALQQLSSNRLLRRARGSTETFLELDERGMPRIQQWSGKRKPGG